MSGEKRKELGRIQKVRVGIGGYQDAQFGIWFTLGSAGWGVQDGRGFWSMKPTPDCKWTEADQNGSFAELARYILELLRSAKVESVDALLNKPIEVEFDGNLLKSWRILEEVL